MWLTGSNIRLSQSTEYRVQSTERAFSFIELMIATVILLVGLVAIIQGFIIAAGALNTANNHLCLLPFLEAKMQNIEFSAKKEGGLKKLDSQGQYTCDSRNFAWNLQIKDIEGDYDPKLDEKLKEAKLEINWKEQNYPKSLSLVTYLKVKKNE